MSLVVTTAERRLLADSQRQSQAGSAIRLSTNRSRGGSSVADIEDQADQAEFSASPNIEGKMSYYNFLNVLKTRPGQKPGAQPQRTPQRKTHTSMQVVPLTEAQCDLCHTEETPFRSPQPEPEHRPVPSLTKVAKLKKLKKDFYLSQGRKGLTVRSFKRKLARPSAKQLRQPPDTVSKLARMVTYRDLGRDTKDIEDCRSFCGYLMQPPTEGTLEIRVVDTGIGMSEGDMKNLFKPFSQTNKGIHAQYGGTGLGLWLSHSLVKAMKGTITCSSKPGFGTTFTVRVPARCKMGHEPSKVLDIAEPNRRNRNRTRVWGRRSEVWWRYACSDSPKTFRR